MHVDKYVVNNIGTKWVKGKEKKNVIIGTIDGNSINLKKLAQLLEDWHETVNGEYASRNIELVINVTEEDQVFVLVRPDMYEYTTLPMTDELFWRRIENLRRAALTAESFEFRLLYYNQMMELMKRCP